MTEKLFIFAHGGIQYGVPVMQVLEIAELGALLPAHGDMPACLGNVSHRNHLLPVLDPTALSCGRGMAAPKRFVILSEADTVFGLALDSFISIAASDPVDTSGSAGDANLYVERARAYRDNALVLLSIGAIVKLVQRHFAQQRFQPGATDLGSQAAGAIEEVLLCARLDDIRFAIPIQHEIEIVEGNEVTPLFKVPAIMRGLINLRGQVLACLDISTELGLEPRPLGERNQFVVLTEQGVELALCVDKVTGIRRLAPDQVQKADMMLAGDMKRLATGVHEGEDGPLLILAVPNVFAAPALLPHIGVDA